MIKKILFFSLLIGYVNVGISKILYMGQGKSYTNLQQAMAAMSAGDILIISNGTYSGPNNVIDNDHQPPSGTPNNYTTIKAEKNGLVFFDGEDIRNMFHIRNRAYIQFEGIRWGNQWFDEGSGIIKLDGPSGLTGVHHIKMFRCGVFNARDGKGGDGFLLGRCSYILLEECYAYGNGRYYFYVGKDAEKIILRRCVVRPDCHKFWDGHSAFNVYDAKEVEIQNCIAIDADNGQAYYVNGDSAPNQPRAFMVRNTGQGFDMTDVFFRGCIALNFEKGFLMYGSQSQGSVHFENCVFWEGREGVRPRGDNVRFNHCIVGNVTGTTSNANGFYMETGDEPVTNSIIYNIQNNYGIRAATKYSLSDYNCLYHNHDNFHDNCIAGSNSICSENSNAIDPLTGSPGNGIAALKYLVRIEDGSDLDQAADDYADIGVNILYKIGVSGTLWGDPGFNEITCDHLWPFPYEGTIAKHMRNYSAFNGGISGNRGFCADNQTLTNYIWGYLGKTPPDFYPPQLNFDNLSPEQDAMAVDVNSDILINLVDTGTGINVSSVLMKINDEIVYNGTQPNSSPAITVSGTIHNYFIKYTPSQPLPANSRITISVDAQDLASPPNTMPTLSISFTTAAESSVAENQSPTITRNRLTPNYPNPFNSGTMLEYHLKQQGKVNLQIYNITGRFIKNLADGEYDKGVYQIHWDGSDNFGNQTSSGIYICKLFVDQFVQSQKLVKLE